MEYSAPINHSIARKIRDLFTLMPSATILLPILIVTTSCEPNERIPLDESSGAARFSPEATVCAGSSTLQGIDVSSWQGSIDWDSVAASGRSFAVARIGDGYYIDSYFPYNWQRIKEVGMIRGAYQFFRAGEDPYDQAQIVIDAVGTLGDGDLPVTLDIEDQSVEGVPTSTVVANMNAWLDAVEIGTGKRPIIYTGYYVFDDYMGYDDYSIYPLWIANWYVSCPTIPPEWSTWAFWQYSSTGSVPGIYGNVDLDIFNGDWNALVALAGPTSGGGGTSVTNPAIAGNWDGVGGHTIGLFDNTNALWSLNNALDGSRYGYQFGWGPHGNPNAVPIAGDWNGDGSDTVGLWYRDSAQWTMTNYNVESGVDYEFGWGPTGNANAFPIAGDWNGDGVDTVGLWYRDTASWKMTDYNMESGEDYNFGWGATNNYYAIPIAGDWNGDGVDTVGIWYRDSSTWKMTNYNMESGEDYSFQWGPTNDANVIPIVGDWNDDGVDTVGLYNLSAHEWTFTNYNVASGVNYQFTWDGTIDDQSDPANDPIASNGGRSPAIAGSWTGGTVDGAGLYRFESSEWALNAELNGNGYGYDFGWGPANDPDAIPISGDWNGDWIDTVGLWYRDSALWKMTNYNVESGEDYSFGWGAQNDPDAWPIAGDWNGDGVDTVGLWYRDTAAWRMTNYNMASGEDYAFGWGPQGDTDAWPIAGDWNGDGIDTVGLWYRDTGVWKMTNYNMASGEDYSFQWGPIGDASVWPVVGDWNGDGIDTPGLYHQNDGYWEMTDVNGSSGVYHQFYWGGGIVGPPATDADHDGWSQAEDCNDNDSSVFPGATEVCNGTDDNCNGVVDDGLAEEVWYLDLDGDGYGNPDEAITACSQPLGYVSADVGDDCDDTDPTVSPGEDEYPNDGIDNDCDGRVDETPGGCSGSGGSDPTGPTYPAILIPILLVAGQCGRKRRFFRRAP